MKSTNFLFVYVTYPNQESATQLSSLVIQHKLAACANLLPQVTSIYEWNSNIESQTEVVAIYKTQDSCFEKLKTMIIENHSYDCPCIVAIPITHGNDDFLNWIKNTTSIT